MPEAYIDFFMRWIDRQSCEFFFSRNFALQDLRDLRESMNTWSPRPGVKWKTLFLEHHNDGERPTQTTLYQKSEHDAAQRQAAAVPTIEKLLNGELTNQILAELVDLIRLTMNEAQILLLLRKIAAYPFVPKEAWYLVTWLATHGTHAFLSENRKEISAMKKALDRLHEKL